MKSAVGHLKSLAAAPCALALAAVPMTGCAAAQHRVLGGGEA